MLKIDAYIEEKKELLDRELKRLLPIQEIPQKKLFEAANYALHPGGKRLRPILFLATVDTFDENSSDFLDIACSLELIHTYSLIHDDLPCMDNDDFRRNKPSLHKAFSEADALLTGDFLLTFAFQVISESSFIKDDQKVKLINALTKYSGALGLIGGQHLDLLYENEDLNFDLLKEIHIKKTSSLFMAALEAAAIVVNSTHDEREALINFGEKLGLSFQIIDDILDADETKKVSILTFLTPNKAKELAKNLYDEAILHLASLPYPPPLLKDLAFKLIKKN